MIKVEIRSEKGIHSPEWKVFHVGSMSPKDNINKVFKKFGENFASGYHYYQVRFMHEGKVLPFATKLEDLTKSEKLILQAIKVSEESMPDESWKPKHEIDSVFLGTQIKTSNKNNTEPKMVSHCFSSKYGPYCYDVTKKEHQNIKALTFLLILSFVILLVLWMISYYRKKEDLTKTNLFKLIGIITISIFIILALYESYVKFHSKFLCTGYHDCAKFLE